MITCTGCSLLCSDILIDKKGDVYGACMHGIERLKLASDKKRVEKPVSYGVEINLEKALSETIDLLKKSSKILVYGMEFSTNEAVKAWFELARKTGGIVSPRYLLTTSLFWSRTVGGKKFLGSLTKARNEGDVIVFAHVNPADTSLRLASRYIVFPRGEKIPDGRENRTLVIIDNRETATMKMANYKFAAQNTMEIIECIALSVSERKTVVPKGIPETRFSLLVRDLVEARTPVIVASLDGVEDPLRYARSLLRMIKALEERGTKPILIPLPESANGAGVTNIMLEYTSDSWPIAYDFGDNKRVKLEEALDAVETVVIVCSDPFTHLPLHISSKLLSKNVIIVEERRTLTSMVCRNSIVIPVGITGVETGGLMTRCDGEIVELNPPLKLPSNLTSEEKVVSELVKAL